MALLLVLVIVLTIVLVCCWQRLKKHTAKINKAELEPMNQTLKQQNDDLRQENEDLKGTNHGLEQNINELEKSVQEKEQLIQSLQQQNDSEVKLACANTKLEYQEEVARLRHAADDGKKYKTELDELKKRYENCRSESETLRRELDVANVYLELYKKDQCRMEQQCSKKDPLSGYTPPRDTKKEVTDTGSLIEDIVEHPPPSPATLHAQTSSPEPKKDAMPTLFESIADNQIALKAAIKVTDSLLREIQRHHILTEENVTSVKMQQSEDGRVERLLAVLAQCDNACLPKLYEALKAAGQEDVVSLLRAG